MDMKLLVVLTSEKMLFLEPESVLARRSYEARSNLCWLCIRYALDGPVVILKHLYSILSASGGYCCDCGLISI